MANVSELRRARPGQIFSVFLFLGALSFDTAVGFVHSPIPPLMQPNRQGRNALIRTSAVASIEGDILTQEEFDRLSRIATTIEALQEQLPVTLTKPLTSVSAPSIFDAKCRLTILVDDEKIELLKTREELIALSDVLVVGTAAAQQANSVFLGSTPTRTDSQILLDSSCKSLLIPWKAKSPVFPGMGSSDAGINKFEGLSEFVVNEEGKIQEHILRKVSWNGQALKGPAIGRTLKALQSTMSNIQNSPLFRGLNTNGWMGEGFLEQVASAASSGRSADSMLEKPEVRFVKSVANVTGWWNGTEDEQMTTIPMPGTSDWLKYSSNREAIIDFCNNVVTQLSTTRDLTAYFSNNATLVGVKGNILLSGQEKLSNFFQGLALARRSTGGEWVLKKATVVDWTRRKVEIEYEASNNPLISAGKDIYTLSVTNASPVIECIEQVELKVRSSDGYVSIDGPWVMNNLANAARQANTPSAIAPSFQNLFSDLLFQQQPKQTSSLPRKKTQIPQASAANVFYLMSEFHECIPKLWNSTSTQPPAAAFLSETVTLKGYLGETLLRGSGAYKQVIGSLILTTRQAIAQKRLVLDGNPIPKVELTPKGNVRVYLVLKFRLPPPGSVFSDAAAVPLTLELVSDYVIDPELGLVKEQRLIESRVNGQLTPGDVLSRNLQRLLKLEQDTPQRGTEDMLQTVTDAISWFRSFSSPNGSKR